MVADRGRIGQAAVEPRGVAGRGVDEVHTLTDRIVPLKGELCREHGILIRRETDAAVRRGRKLRHTAAPVEHDLLDAVGEALVRHAVEHDVADCDLPVHGLVAGLRVDDVAEPVDVTRAVEALAALEQLLPGRVDAQAGIVRAERSRDAEDLLQIRQRQHHFAVKGVHPVGRVEAAAVGRVAHSAVGRRDVRTVDRDGLGVAVGDGRALKTEHLGKRIRRKPGLAVDHIAVTAETVINVHGRVVAGDRLGIVRSVHADGKRAHDRRRRLRGGLHRQLLIALGRRQGRIPAQDRSGRQGIPVQPGGQHRTLTGEPEKSAQ